MGWTTEAALLAEVVDMTAFVAQAAGQNKRAKHKRLVERPKTVAAKKRRRLDQID